MNNKILILTSVIFFLSCTNEENNMNPFLQEYDTPFKIPPFEDIKMQHYKPAFELGMEENLLEINKITSNPEKPSFENTIVELERVGKTLDKVSNVFFNLLSSNTNEDMDDLAMTISPRLSAHGDNILLNKELLSLIHI